jgi:hypothetical protein
VRRLRGAVPPSGITGATFVGDRMFVAGQGGGPFRVWSIDLATGQRRLEMEREIVGESEGLVTASLPGGTLHWLIQPFTTDPRPPTYGPGHATLLSFRRSAGTARPSVRLLRRSRATVLRHRGFTAAVRCPRGCTARLRVLQGHRVLARSTKRARPSGRHAPQTLVRLTARGRRVLRTHHGRLRLTLRATLREPSGRVTRRTVRARLR